jgi:hypothetical protein
MADETRKAAAGRDRELADLRRRLAELEESQARDRKMIEELRRSGELFRSIADTATDAILSSQGIKINLPTLDEFGFNGAMFPEWEKGAKQNRAGWSRRT